MDPASMSRPSKLSILAQAQDILRHEGTFDLADAIARLNYTPETGKVMTVSTSHLPADIDDEWWSAQMEVTAERYEYGWWLCVPDESGDRATDPTILAVWKRARELGCKWVRLNDGGPIDPSLPVHVV